MTVAPTTLPKPAGRRVTRYDVLRRVPVALTIVAVLVAAIYILFVTEPAPISGGGSWRTTNFGSAIHDPTDFAKTFLDAITFAALLFVVASGFTLIFGLMRTVNMAHGTLFLLGGYIAFDLQQYFANAGGFALQEVPAWQWFLPAIVAAVAIAGVGLVMQQAFLRWTQGQELRQALITIAVSIIIGDQMLKYWPLQDSLAWPSFIGPNNFAHIGGIVYAWSRLFILLVAVVIGVSLYLWLHKTKTGMVIRAGVDDRHMVSALGINIQRAFAIAFVVGAGARGLRRLDGRRVLLARARRRRELAAQLAGRRDHRRNGFTRRRGHRRHPLRVRLHFLGGLPADFEPRLLHRILANLHFRTADRGARPAPARPVRKARVTDSPAAAPSRPPTTESGFRHWWNSKTPAQLFEYGVVAAALIVVTLGYRSMGVYFAHDLMTNVFWYGIAAASLIFLSAYGGMVSLAQVSLYGISAFVLGNTVTTGSVKGLHLGYDPWIGIVLAITITTGIGLLLGAVASRSAGIYFLMITLAFAVLTSVFFGSVTILSGFSGISGLELTAPSIIGSTVAHPDRIYYTALVASVLVYLLIRYIIRTPFGITLQGTRDDPVRMASLGYNVALHRTLAMGFGAFIASIAGIIYAWQFGHVDPTGTISLSPVIDLLVIAVIGSLYSVEGAWIGAFVFVVLQNYARDLPLVHYVGITQQRFETMIGVIFLLIVLLNPGGILGIWAWIKEQVMTLLDRDDSPAETPGG